MKSVSMAGGDNEPDIKPLVFYDALVGDGVATIELGVIPDATATYEVVFKNMGNDQYSFIGGNTTANRWIGWQGHSNDTLIKYSNVTTMRSFQTGIRGETCYRGTITPTSCILSATDGSKSYNNPLQRGTNYNACPLRIIATAPTKEFSVYDSNGSYMMFLLPCKCYGVCGMYDIINKVFYGNSNSEGEFSVEGEGYERD